MGFFRGWSGLRRFWGFLLVLVAGVVGTLQIIGAPPAPMVRPEPPSFRTEERVPSPQLVHPAPPAITDRQVMPGRDSPGPINDPDPALLEPTAGSATLMLPRISPDGRRPMRQYAAGFDQTTTRARVGILIAGIGLGNADSKRAITDLPAGVTFAVSPYTLNADVLLGSIRLAGHEYLVSLPMEPLRFPLNDPGPNAMLTTLSVEQNQPRLLWALSRFQGYAGATNIMGAMRGERLADMPDQMAPILAELNRRGLMYEAAPGQPSPVPSAWSRAVDLTIDDPTDVAAIDAKLAALETMARDHGAALGLVEAPRPVTVDRLAAWANSLNNRGLALAPVSALMLPPEDKPK